MHRTTKTFTDAIARRTADPTWRRNQRVATMASWLDEERRDKFADAVREGNHKRFHIARGIVSKTCKFCAPVAPGYLKFNGEPFDDDSCKFFDAHHDVSKKFFAAQKELRAAYDRASENRRIAFADNAWNLIQNVGRDRRNQAALREARARGESHYQGKKIYGANPRDFFVRKFTRRELFAVWNDDPEGFT
jgi:hypothetical protein